MKIKKWQLDTAGLPILMKVTLERKEWVIFLENILNEIEDENNEVSAIFELEK